MLSILTMLQVGTTTVKNSYCKNSQVSRVRELKKGKKAENGTVNSGPTAATGQSKPPPEVDPNIPPVGMNRNGPFHLNSDRNFRNS